MNKPGRIQRADYCFERGFLRHCRLLSNYYDQAFKLGNPDYYGEVAGKVRLLVHKSPSNKPILLELMEKYGVSYFVNFPRSGKSLSLADYLDDFAGAFRTPSDRLAKFTNRELVVAWAQQSGAAHEARYVQEDLYAAFNSELMINNVQPHIIKLEKVSSNVLVAAEMVVDAIKSNDERDKAN